MIEYLEKTKRIVWAFVELGFATILAIVLIYLVLGQDSGEFVTSVADNILAFANAIPTQSLVGIAIVLALMYLLAQRLK
ncbi:MAG: hypothetical protein IT539_00985 [Bradyrhizobiaceae bacterium]|nr:hypothetical protein [Bradyrhizobiaceae bacterium]